MLWLGWQWGRSARDTFRAVVAVVALIGLSLAVRSNPYSLPVLGLIVLGWALIEAGFRWSALLVTGAAVFTHEISIVVPVLAMARAVFQPSERRWAIAHGAVWALIYIGLRLVVDARTEGGGLFHDLRLRANLRPTPLLVATVSIGLLLGMWGRSELRALWQQRPAWVLLLAAIIPYAAYVTAVGRLLELRLFLPWMIPVLLLPQADTPRPSSHG